MIRIGAVIFLLAFAIPASAKEKCLMAVIWRDGVATIDWSCVDRYAAEWKPGIANKPAEQAYLMKQIRHGKVHAVLPANDLQR